MNTHPIPATVLLTLAPDQTASRVQIYTDGFTRKDIDRYAAADIFDARNDPDGPQDAWIVRYDFSDQRKIPRIGENRTEDYARSLLRRAHESRIRPCCIIPLRDLMFCAESGIDPLSPQGTHERLIRLDGYGPYCAAQGFGRSGSSDTFRSVRAVELPDGVLLFDTERLLGGDAFRALMQHCCDRFYDPGLSIDRLGVYDIPRLSAEFLLEGRAGSLNFHCGYRNRDFLITSLPAAYILDCSSILEGVPLRSYDMRPTADNYLRFCRREELLPEAWSPNYDMTALLRIAECGYPVKDVPEIWKRKAGSLRDFTDIAARYDPRRPNVLLEREARRRARALLESRYPDRRKPSAENTAPRQTLRAERLPDTLPVRSVKRHSI